jgi:hypothetical protein
VTLRGRHWIAIWLAAFLATAAAVAWRQTVAFRTAGELRRLQTARGALETSRAAAAAAVRRARSKDVLAPLVESRLGLRPANDTEIVILQRPDGP